MQANFTPGLTRSAARAAVSWVIGHLAPGIDIAPVYLIPQYERARDSGLSPSPDVTASQAEQPGGGSVSSLTARRHVRSGPQSLKDAPGKREAAAA